MKCPNPKCSNRTHFKTEAFEVVAWDYNIKLTYENGKALIDDEYEAANSEPVSTYMTPQNTKCTCEECNFVGPLRQFVENDKGVNHEGFLRGYNYKNLVAYEIAGQRIIPMQEQRLIKVEQVREYFNWREALNRMAKEHKVSRKEWGTDDYLYMENGVLKDDGGNEYLSRLTNWDIGSNDWYVYREGE